MGNVVKLSGKKLVEELYETQCVIYDSQLRRPCLCVITIGNDDASKVYVKNKKQACERCNIKFIHKVFLDTDDINVVKEYISTLNYDDTIDGILVQQPVPDKFKGVEQLIDDNKDVDGFSTYNIGGTLTNRPHISACTPSGIIDLFHYYNIDLCGKHVVIIGRSNIVGKPLIGMLLSKNATVTSCNSYTNNIKDITRTADIIISAMGKPKLLDADYLSSKCICVIDVGINRDENNKLCGDCDYDNIVACWNLLDDNIERYITPVPGGVGPMTVYSLIKNVNIAYSNHIVDSKG